MNSPEFHQASQCLLKHQSLLPPTLHDSFTQVLNYLNSTVDTSESPLDPKFLKVLESLPKDFAAFLFIIELKRLLPDLPFDKKTVEMTRELFLKPNTTNNAKKYRISLVFSSQKLQIFNEKAALNLEISLNSMALRWIGKLPNENLYGFSLDSFDFKAKTRNFLIFSENHHILKDFYENIRLTLNPFDSSGLFIRGISETPMNSYLRSNKSMVNSTRINMKSESPKPKRLISINFRSNKNSRNEMETKWKTKWKRNENEMEHEMKHEMEMKWK